MNTAPHQDDHLAALASQLRERAEPLVLPWPSKGNLGGFRSFPTLDAWVDCLSDLNVSPLIPDIVTRKYQRAQKLYLLGWLDQDIFPAGELIAFTALELSLNDRYGTRVKARWTPKPDDMSGKLPQRALVAMLKFMVDEDGLTDGKMQIVQRYGGTIVPFLTGAAHPTLPEIRNELAHGAPFDQLPRSGLLELIRDLIEYAYRGYIEEHRQVLAGRGLHHV